VNTWLFYKFTQHVGAWNQHFISANTSPKLKLSSSSSKVNPEGMQEIWDNTSVDSCSSLPKESMWSYLVVPTYLMELLWNFSPHLGWLKGGTFRSCLSYLASFWNQSERIWYYGSSMLGTRTLFLWFLTFGSTNVPFHPTLERLNMWSSWVKRKGTTEVMYIAKLKDGPKRAKKTFSIILERVFKMVWRRERKWNHIKRIFEVELFFSS
jgi:hypothetical protein